MLSCQLRKQILVVHSPDAKSSSGHRWMKPTRSLLSNHTRRFLFPIENKQNEFADRNYSGDCVSFCSINFPTNSLSLFGDISPYMLSVCMYPYITLTLHPEAAHWKIHESKTKNCFRIEQTKFGVYREIWKK